MFLKLSTLKEQPAVSKMSLKCTPTALCWLDIRTAHMLALKTALGCMSHKFKFNRNGNFIMIQRKIRCQNKNRLCGFHKNTSQYQIKISHYYHYGVPGHQKLQSRRQWKLKVSATFLFYSLYFMVWCIWGHMFNGR